MRLALPARAGVTVAVAAALLSPVSPAEAKPVKDIKISRASSLEPTNGDQVTFKGVAPTLKGKSVSLLRRVGGKGESWIKVGQARVARDGTFTVAGTATGVGQNSWKVKAKVRKTAHTSPMRRTTVFTWFYLGDLDVVDDSNGFIDGGGSGGYTKTVGGEQLVKSVYTDTYNGRSSGDIRFAEWNASYACKTFAANIGADDDSATGFKASFNLYRDGEKVSLGTMGLGPSKPVTSDISGRLRIKLETVTGQSPTGSTLYGEGVFGSARMLCSKAP